MVKLESKPTDFCYQGIMIKGENWIQTGDRHYSKAEKGELTSLQTRRNNPFWQVATGGILIKTEYQQKPLCHAGLFTHG